MSDADALDLERRLLAGDLDAVPELANAYSRTGRHADVKALWRWYQANKDRPGVPVDLLAAMLLAERQLPTKSHDWARQSPMSSRCRRCGAVSQAMTPEERAAPCDGDDDGGVRPLASMRRLAKAIEESKGHPFPRPGPGA